MKLTAIAITFSCSIALVSAVPVSDSVIAPLVSGAESAKTFLMRRTQKKVKGKKDKKGKKGRKNKKDHGASSDS
jgi:hypothetical protein